MLTFSLFFSVVTSNLVVFAFSLFFSSVISNLVVFFQALESQSIRYAVFHSVYNYWKKKVAPSILWWNQFFSFPRILSSGWDQKLFPIPSNVACFSLQFRLILFSVYSTFTFACYSRTLTFFMILSFYQREQWQKPILRRLQVKFTCFCLHPLSCLEYIFPVVTGVQFLHHLIFLGNIWYATSDVYSFVSLSVLEVCNVYRWSFALDERICTI